MAQAPLAALALVPLVLAAPFWQTKVQKRSEMPLYSGPRFALKLTRWVDKPFLGRESELVVLSCMSDSTRREEPAAHVDGGWVELGRLPVGPDDTDESLEQTARTRFRAIDDRVLVWTGVALSVSYYGCRAFERFDPTLLPAEMIDPAPRGPECQPAGEVDCRYADFLGERWPDYSDIRASADGRISFVLRSQALRDPQPLHVESGDYGKTWRIEGKDLPVPAPVRR